MSGAWHQLCRADDVVAARPHRVVVTGAEDELAVCLVRGAEDRLVAVRDRCPHRDVALSNGLVTDGRLVCPGHFWRFDLVTGERTDLPEHRLTLYETRVVDGWVEARLPAPEPRRSVREWLLAEARAQQVSRPDDVTDPRASR